MSNEKPCEACDKDQSDFEGEVEADGLLWGPPLYKAHHALLAAKDEEIAELRAENERLSWYWDQFHFMLARIRQLEAALARKGGK